MVVPRACVYVFECEGYYKIGMTTGRLQDRKQGMQTGNPFPIEIKFSLPCEDKEDAKEWESKLHGELDEYHHRGEWYDIPESVYQNMKDDLFDMWPCNDYILRRTGFDKAKALDEFKNN